MPKEKALIEAMKQGSEEAFEEIYYRYQNLVYFVIYDILKNRSSSEEVMQDTFLKMYQNIHSFDGRYFQAWLLKIAKNLAINRYKQEPKMVELADYAAVDQCDQKSNTLEMMRELESILSPNEYQVVILTIVYNMKQKDIAQYLDKPMGTVSWLYSQGIKKLKNYYQKGER